ncbi:STAS domain-containing protein [Streptomyces sp. NBC_01477]|uniref:STAS domain-containing protein n=1 Tax=Streptomyces sp. NBC_01477 TaxID=2976015 RepID=UPI002E3398D4|nr:STAS domain-containing protein [Streptomyces sp. NBC_01477]
MTTMPSAHLRLTTVDSEDTVRIELHGDLDYDNAEVLLAAVTAKIADNPRLGHLHLHCAGLVDVDTMGLSVLLMIRRRTRHAGVRLHLDGRTAQLDRLLDVTGSLDYLTAPADGAEESSLGGGSPSSAGGEAQAARPSGPDSTS